MELFHKICFGIIDFEHVFRCRGYRNKNIEGSFIGIEFIGRSFFVIGHYIYIETGIVKKKAVVLQFKKKIFSNMLLFDLLVLVEYKDQKSFDHKKKKYKTLYQ